MVLHVRSKGELISLKTRIDNTVIRVNAGP
jgi:hypothetical protein